MSKYEGGWVALIKGLPRQSRTWNGRTWDVRNNKETFDYLVEGLSSLAKARPSIDLMAL